LLVGLVIGLGGGWLMDLAKQRGWLAASYQKLTLLALPFMCFLFSEPLGASPFIAAFVGGLVVRISFKTVDEQTVDFSHNQGKLFDLVVFFFFGLLLGPTILAMSWAVALYAVLSLTLIRMLPVALSLIGTGLSRSSVLFLGWFGPRGLASIVLALVFLEKEAHLPGQPVIAVAVVTTVLFSVVAHGVSAMPGIGWYHRQLKSVPADAPEFQETVVSPARVLDSPAGKG
jgi:NhaP-type Na+/H+ or K+/H+ antiporter